VLARSSGTKLPSLGHIGYEPAGGLADRQARGLIAGAGRRYPDRNLPGHAGRSRRRNASKIAREGPRPTPDLRSVMSKRRVPSGRPESRPRRPVIDALDVR